MRLYVNCKDHPRERIYIQFRGKEPQYRGDIPFPVFLVTCSITEKDSLYTLNEVHAEEGAQLPIVGAGLGVLLFFINPISELIRTVIGLMRDQVSEEEKVKQFNKSRTQ